MTFQRPPGPKGHFLLGNIPQYRDNTLAYEKHIARTYGDVVHIRFAHRHAYQMNHPDAVRQVLVEDADKFHKAPIYKLLLTRFLGNGLLTSDGDFWRRQRKLVQPAFHSRRIQNYADVMVNNTVRMLDRWDLQHAQDINREMMRLTLGVVAKTLFDADVESDADTVGEALTVLLDVTNESAQSPILGIPEWIPTRNNRRGKAATAALDAIVMRIINERRASGEDTGDLLSMLLMTEDENGERMTDKQVRDEAVTIFLAGHETTANALTWAWVLLAQHPEVEAKLISELDHVLGGRLPAFEDLRQLEYTQMVVKETMRLYPPIPSIGRQAMEDITVNGTFVPKGTIVLIAPHVLHRDPRWFTNPDVFDPERFNKENIAACPKYAYIPFAGGPRVCIGNMFAEMEAALVLATMAQRMRLQLEPGQSCEPEAILTLRPKHHIAMRAEAREATLALA